jgi:hypothetical protein
MSEEPMQKKPVAQGEQIAGQRGYTDSVTPRVDSFYLPTKIKDEESNAESKTSDKQPLTEDNKARRRGQTSTSVNPQSTLGSPMG